MVSNAVSMRTADVAGAVEGGMDMEGGMEIAAVEIAAVEINEEQAGLETVAGMKVNALTAQTAVIVTANGVEVAEVAEVV